MKIITCFGQAVDQFEKNRHEFMIK